MTKRPPKANAQMTLNLLERPHEKRIVAKVNGSQHGESVEISHALGLEPRESPQMKEELFLVLRHKGTPGAFEALQRLRAELTEGLPAALRRGPLECGHFAFDTDAKMVEWLVLEVERMRTKAKSLPEFQKGVRGREAHIIGQILHERLIKHHPFLQAIYLGAAQMMVDAINKEITQTGFATLLRPDGHPVTVTKPFTNPRLIEDTQIDGKAAPDWGVISNSDELRLYLPVEIKLEGPALKKAPKQMESLDSRLSNNPTLQVWTSGADHPETILTQNLLLPTRDSNRLVITGTTDDQLQKLVGTGTTDGVATVLNVTPRQTSGAKPRTWYEMQVLVKRDWLVDIVKLFRKR
jgi:hypothetical protein